MTNTNEAAMIAAEADDRLQPAASAPTQRRGLRERGMVTIEYAIGAVLVLVLVGVIIASIQQGWFGTMVKDLVQLLLQEIPKALTLGG